MRPFSGAAEIEEYEFTFNPETDVEFRENMDREQRNKVCKEEMAEARALSRVENRAKELLKGLKVGDVLTTQELYARGYTKNSLATAANRGIFNSDTSGIYVVQFC